MDEDGIAGYNHSKIKNDQKQQRRHRDGLMVVYHDVRMRKEISNGEH